MLELLCAHALSFGAEPSHAECQDGWRHVFAVKNGAAIRIANYPISGRDSRELNGNLTAAAKKPVRSVIEGEVWMIHVEAFDNLGEGAFAIKMVKVPKLDPSTTPSFTAKQGQYLSFIHHYTKIHGQPPAETDLQCYFRVSAPSIHGMIKTLERNGLIEKTPGQARSIRVIAQPAHLPKLT